MKTTYNPKKSAVLLTALSTGIETVQLMKTKLTILKHLIILCSTVATTAVFGQTPQTYVWTNQYTAHNAGVGDMNLATNWNPNGVPTPMTPTADANGAYGDLMQFSGLTTGPLSVTESGGTLGGGGGQSYPAGARIELTSAQTNSVTIFSVLAVSGGLRMNWFTIDPGAGPLILGDHSLNCLDIVGGELNGQIFGFTNNSSTPCVVNETLRWRMGGAGAHPHVFAGTGDWIVNNRMRSANGSSILVQKDGPGTMTWTATNTANANFTDPLGSPVRIFAGTMILKSSDILNAAAGGANPVGIVHNGTLLKFDYTPAPGIITTPDSIPGNISGAGPIQVNAGTITLAGASTFSGNINLTGGELIAGSVENVGVSGPLGQGGTISFNGGTLGWNLANAFDYSSRFNTSASQVYNLDTGGSSPTFATGLTSSGGSLNKLGGGTLTLAGANSYSGPTTVASGGQLLFQGTMSSHGNVTVSDSAALGVVENDSQIRPSTLSLGASTGATLEFNNVTNHATATLAPTNLASAGTATINVNSGRFRTIGEVFPLLSWTSGTAPAVSLGFLAGAGGHLVTNISGVEIDLVIDDPPYIWTDLAADDTWNITSVDWQYSGANVPWVNGHYSLMDDTAGGTGNVTLSGTIAPTNATINNSALTYAITSSPGNVIGGLGGLTKSGNGILTLPGGTNTYTGVTTIGGGVLGVTVLANGGVASDIGAASSANTNIVLNGGTLQYTGPGISVNRLFSVGQNGGTIDNEGAAVLVFNNSGSLGMSGNGPRQLTLTGPNIGDTIACGIVNHPAGTTLRKDGLGTWILTGTNTYANGTTLASGTLQVGAGGQSGTLGSGNISTATGTSIDFQRSGTLLVPGAISGSASVTIDSTNGTVILANNNTYNGGTTINAGTLQVGNGGGTGSLNTGSPIVDNSLLVFNTAGTFVYGSGGSGIISGPGNVIVQGGGFIKALGNNTYTGWTRIDANTTFQPAEGQDGLLASVAVTNNGTLRLVRQDAVFTYAGPIVGSGKLQIGANNVNVGVITLTGTNTYAGGTFIGDNTLVLGDNATAGAGAIASASTNVVQFVNNFTLAQDNPRTLEFNRPAGDDFTFNSPITTNFATPQVNMGIVQLQGGATVTLTANNTYGSGTVVNAGSVVVGNGGSSGSVGFGPVTLTSGNPLVINRTGSLAIPGAVTGSGGVTLINSATVTLSSGANTYGGATTVSNGTLVVTSLGGELDVEGGTVIVQGTATAANLNVPGSMNIGSGTVVATLNKALSQSNTTYSVSGSANYTGGTLKLLTAGPALTVGDQFFIFNGPVSGGAAMPIVSPGCTVQNNLAVDGSVTVTSAQPLPTNLTYTVVSGTNLVLSWPAAWTGGVHLQSQTNPITKGLSSNWVTIPGTDLSNSYTTTINKLNGSVFYRLVIP
jgi:fibronectin-binding autotransporter adhesin